MVHGMNTTGAWQKDLFPCLQDAAIRAEAVDYGKIWFRVLTMRHSVAEKIHAAYEELRRFAPSPSIIAHSYGTLGFARALEYWPSLQFANTILAGCVLPRGYDWPGMFEAERLRALLHEVAMKDWVANIAALAGFLGILPCGSSGRHGFSCVPHPNIVEKRYPYAQHGSVFHREHYRKVWIPFLLEGLLGQTTARPTQ
jgi:hypothetical protein